MKLFAKCKCDFMYHISSYCDRVVRIIPKNVSLTSIQLCVTKECDVLSTLYIE